ncbi:MAG: hypothetical protein SF187_24600 [Deltaproteobacteria bacterium]|nr:hypothetical protein [Deltaproteobacteria bacterium]
MFEDFDKSQKPAEGRGRLLGSYLVSAGIIVGVAATLAATIATATVIVKKRRDVEVSFADLPPPPPPKPKVKKKATPGARKLAVRQKLAAPKEIPAEQPSEAEGQLAVADDTGPVEGFVAGTAGDGDGGEVAKPPEAPPPPAPPAPEAPPEDQEVERITAPQFLSGCRTPEIPDDIVTTAATIQIEVRMLIGPDGRVADAKIIKSHPLIPDDLILRCARAQVFEPAHLPEGLAVPYPFRRRFTFKPSGA